MWGSVHRGQSINTSPEKTSEKAFIGDSQSILHPILHIGDKPNVSDSYIWGQSAKMLPENTYK